MCALHHQALFHQAFQVVLVVKNLLANVGEIRDTGSIPVSGRFPRERHCNPLQYSCLKNPMDRGAWQAIVHRVTKIQTQLQQLSMHAHTIRHCIIRMLYSYKNSQFCYQSHFTKYKLKDYFF